MFKNYLKIAWRNLIKNKGYSAINIGGLALGMAVALIIGLWIQDELSNNSYFSKSRKYISPKLLTGIRARDLPYPDPWKRH
jgi:putative ABC transport system permease protein